MFSIIVPLYNKEAYFNDTIKSVLNQTFKDFELIIVNDGSTDSSLVVAQSFHDKRIKIFTKENGGVSSARNFGMEKAKHNYIAFLDADDHWEHNYLDELNSLIAKYPECGMYASAHTIIYENHQSPQCTHLPEGIVEEYFKEMIKNSVTWTSATIISKKAYEKVGGFPVGMVAGQDSYMWAKIAREFKVAFTPKLLASYNLIFSGGYLRAGKADTCKENWIDLYDEGKFYQNEFLAQKGLKAGIRHATGLHFEKSKQIERDFSYTKLFKRRWRTLNFLNKLPPFGVRAYIKVYDLYMSLKYTFTKKN